MRWKNLRFLKKVKSKKVIGIILSVVIAVCSTIPTFAQSKQQLNNNQNKIEITNINNKVIGIKGRDNMRNNNIQGRKLHVKATAYTSAKNEGGSLTYLGTKCRWGVIAVDKNVIPLGSTVYIPQFNMYFKAEDTGSSIKGNKIDIWMPSYKQAMDWGIRNIDIIVID